MAGALPFTGGAYGYARGIYGPYMGFMVGALEIITNVSGLASIVVAFAQTFVLALDISIAYFPVFFILLFAVTSLVQLLEYRKYTVIICVLTVVSILLTMVYTFGSIPQLDYSKYAYNSDIPRTTTIDVMSYMPVATYFFTGLEMLPILAHFAEEPRRAITYAIGSTVSFGVMAMFTTVVIAVGQAPGIDVMQSTSLPLNFGFANMFGISSRLAHWFNLPLLTASFMIGEYFLCIIIRSLAESGLIFARFKVAQKTADDQMPFPLRAMLFSYVLMILFSLLIFLVLYFSFNYIISVSYFMCLCFYALYICLFVTYISFAHRFPLIPRYYVSPFGVTGAYVGIVLYGFMAVMTFLYPNGGVVLAIWIGTMALLTYLYLTRVRGHQKFSGEEERVFFIAFVIKSNSNSKRRIARRATMKKQQQCSCFDRLSSWLVGDVSHQPPGSGAADGNRRSLSIYEDNSSMYSASSDTTDRLRTNGSPTVHRTHDQSQGSDRIVDVPDVENQPAPDVECEKTSNIHSHSHVHVANKHIIRHSSSIAETAVDSRHEIKGDDPSSSLAEVISVKDPPKAKRLTLTFEDALASHQKDLQIFYLQQFENPLSSSTKDASYSPSMGHVPPRRTTGSNRIVPVASSSMDGLNEQVCLPPLDSPKVAISIGAASSLADDATEWTMRTMTPPTVSIRKSLLANSFPNHPDRVLPVEVAVAAPPLPIKDDPSVDQFVVADEPPTELIASSHERSMWVVEDT
eukprot:gene5005-3576_t